jgi:thiamine pyrophosphokinase
VKTGVFANGEYGNIDFYRKEIKNLDYIIGVDGGNNFLKKIDKKPDLVVGDLDSIKEEVLKWLSDTKILRFSKDKDKSDTCIALEKATSIANNKVFVFGGLGKRIDHTYSNLLLLTRFDFTFKEEHVEIFSVKDSKNFKCNVGETWSLLPLKDVNGLTISGFKYKAKDLYMPKNNPIGLSNVTISENLSIKIESGVLIVFRYLLKI